VTYSITATRPLAAPPGTPADRVEALRKAFDATMKDPDFLADAKKIGAEISPMSGEELDRLLQNVFSTEPRIIDLFKQATETSG
jgi:tripartite-type tricarboxylate transporter receptor subunit TctC